MDYANADGSAAEMCGNGIRCVGVLLHDLGLVDGTEIDVLTRAGVKHLTLHPDTEGQVRRVTVTMGTPNFTRAAIPMRGPAWETFLGQPFDIGSGLTLTASAVSMGNPHLVVFVDGDPVTVHVGHIGPALERHELFPEHTNVEFAYVHDGVAHARVWERGSGETMACGSGACAVAVAANEAGLVPARSPCGSLEATSRCDRGRERRGAADGRRGARVRGDRRPRGADGIVSVASGDRLRRLAARTLALVDVAVGQRRRDRRSSPRSERSLPRELRGARRPRRGAVRDSQDASAVTRRSSCLPVTSTPCRSPATCPARSTHGAVVGRGASDMKGALAVMLELADELAGDPSASRRRSAVLRARGAAVHRERPAVRLFDRCRGARRPISRS